MFETCSNTIFRENPSSGSKVIYAGRQTDGRTYRHDEANNRVAPFCERAKKV